MAAPSKNFNAPTDGQVDGDSPVDTTLMTQLRDCLIHLEEWLGHSYTAAQNHNHDGVNSALIQEASAGNVSNFLSSTAETDLTSTTYTKIFEIVMPVGGEFRFKWDTTEGSGGVQTTARLYKNGVAVGTEYTTGTGTATDDQSGWIQGDLIQLYAKATSTPGATNPKIKDFRVFADKSYNATDTFT